MEEDMEEVLVGDMADLPDIVEADLVEGQVEDLEGFGGKYTLKEGWISNPLLT
jgi:hypothetical protein